MRKWKIRYTLNGQRLETIVQAESQLRAIAMFKGMMPQATSISAEEIH